MQTYNDGVLKLYEDVSKRSSFGAKENEANLQYICITCLFICVFTALFYALYIISFYIGFTIM